MIFQFDFLCIYVGLIVVMKLNGLIYHVDDACEFVCVYLQISFCHTNLLKAKWIIYLFYLYMYISFFSV